MPKATEPTAPLPPMNLEAEEYVLGALMLSPVALENVVEILAPGDFYRGSHAWIYEACLTLHTAGSAVDALTVAAELDRLNRLTEVGGKDRIREIATLVPAATNAPHHARLVREAAARRSLIESGDKVARLGWEPEGDIPTRLAQAEQVMFDLTQSRGRSASDLTHVREVSQEAWKRMEELAVSGRDVIGLPTGFGALDGLTSGLREGNLVIVAGRPSMGKTAFALGVAAHTVLHEKPLPVALFTMEMSKLEVMNRLVSSDALIDGKTVQNPWKLSRDEWERAGRSHARFERSPLYIDESRTANMTEIRTKLRRIKLREPTLGLVVVDYVQLMAAGVRAENRNTELSLISRSLKMLAGELEVPILLVSQLSRDVEDRHDKRPILSDLRDSGALEQDADMVMLVYRDEYYYPDELETKGIAEVNVAKHRNGPIGMRKLAFRDQYAKFTDLHDGPVYG